jgi:proteic killer suppression protein
VYRLPVYAFHVIKTFSCADTRRLFQRERVKRFRAIERVALRKLQQIDFARQLSDLAAPPGNRLEALKGGRKGQHSVRINDQWRICFVWRDGDAYSVEIVDYH